MTFTVVLTENAVSDLEDLGDYIDRHDSPAKADHVLGKLEALINSLSSNPQRGVYPAELLALGIRDYREVFFKPYRCIYRVISERVYVQLIVDGRRDMQRLLQRRLLGSQTK